MRRLFESAAIVLVASVAFAGSAFATTTISAETYVETLCRGIDTLATQVQQLGPAASDARNAYDTTPSHANAIALRQSTIDVLDLGAKYADQLAATSAEIGSPEIPQGSKFAKAVSAHWRYEAGVLQSMADQARDLDVSSSSGFHRDYEALETDLGIALRRSDKQARKNPAFKNLPPSVQPLVVFITTNASTCATA